MLDQYDSIKKLHSRVTYLLNHALGLNPSDARINAARLELHGAVSIAEDIELISASSATDLHRHSEQIFRVAMNTINGFASQPDYKIPIQDECDASTSINVIAEVFVTELVRASIANPPLTQGA